MRHTRKLLSEAVETQFIACGFRAADGIGDFRAIVKDDGWIITDGIMHWLDDEGKYWLAPFKAELHFPDDRLSHYRLRLGRRLDDGSLERLSSTDPAVPSPGKLEARQRGARAKPTVAWFDSHPLADDDWFFAYARTWACDRRSDFEFSLESLHTIAALARQLLSHGNDWRTASELSKLRNHLSCHLEGPMRSSNHDLLRAADGTEQFDIKGSIDDLHICGSMFCLISGLAYFEIDLRIEDDCLVHWALRYQPHDVPRKARKQMEALRYEPPHRFSNEWVVDAENDVPLRYRRRLSTRPPR